MFPPVNFFRNPSFCVFAKFLLFSFCNWLWLWPLLVGALILAYLVSVLDLANALMPTHLLFVSFLSSLLSLFFLWASIGCYFSHFHVNLGFVLLQFLFCRLPVLLLWMDSMRRVQSIQPMRYLPHCPRILPLMSTLKALLWRVCYFQTPVVVVQSFRVVLGCALVIGVSGPLFFVSLLFADQLCSSNVLRT